MARTGSSYTVTVPSTMTALAVAAVVLMNSAIPSAAILVQAHARRIMDVNATGDASEGSGSVEKQEVRMLVSTPSMTGNVTSACERLGATGVYECASTWASGAVGYATVDSVRAMEEALAAEGGDFVVAPDAVLVAPVYDYVVDPTPRSFAGSFSFEKSVPLFRANETLAERSRPRLAATLRTPRRSSRTPSTVNVAGSALKLPKNGPNGTATRYRDGGRGVTSAVPLDSLRIADDFTQGKSTSQTLVVQHDTMDLGVLSAYAGGCLRACRTISNFYFAAPGSNVTIYVIDTPVADHVQFKQVQTGESRLDIREFVSPSASEGTDACTRDLGTHAAAAAVGYEFGTAKDADVVSVGVRAGCGGTGYVSDVLAGLDWILAHHGDGEDVESAIAVFPYTISTDEPASALVARRIEDLVARRVSFAVAAGDTHVDACKFVPANMQSVVTVGGVRVSDDSTSARPWAWTNFNRCVDIFAPAVSIRSASPECFECTSVVSRTANAAARVAGVMAQFIQTNVNASSSDVKAAIMAGATEQLMQNPQFPFRSTTRAVLQSLLDLDIFEVRDVQPDV